MLVHVRDSTRAKSGCGVPFPIIYASPVKAIGEGTYMQCSSVTERSLVCATPLHRPTSFTHLRSKRKDAASCAAQNGSTRPTLCHYLPFGLLRAPCDPCISDCSISYWAPHTVCAQAVGGQALWLMATPSLRSGTTSPLGDRCLASKRTARSPMRRCLALQMRAPGTRWVGAIGVPAACAAPVEARRQRPGRCLHRNGDVPYPVHRSRRSSSQRSTAR